MAHITRRPFVSHYRGTGTGHVVHLRHGKVAHQGVGQAFWFRPLGTVLSEVPVDDRELPLVFRGRTADFQEAAVQGSVTYRFADPLKAARRLDFGLDTSSAKVTCWGCSRATGRAKNAMSAVKPRLRLTRSASGGVNRFASAKAEGACSSTRSTFLRQAGKSSAAG